MPIIEFYCETHKLLFQLQNVDINDTDIKCNVCSEFMPKRELNETGH